jgi:hypothetical protein
MDGQSLQEARKALDEVKALKEARKALDETKAIQNAGREAEASIEEVRDNHPPDSMPPEPEPSPQSPTPGEPVERWRDKHPIEPSLRQKLLAQARRMGRNDGDGKGIF